MYMSMYTRMYTQANTDMHTHVHTHTHTHFCSMAGHPLVGLGLLTFQVSRPHTDTPHSGGLLWTSDRPIADTSTLQHTTLTRDRHPCPRQDSNPQYRQANGQWDGHVRYIKYT
jgi:hypothetical protein